MPYYPDVAGAPQNSIIGGASLWVMGGKKADEYKGVAKFFSFLSNVDRQVKLHTESGYLPITKAAYEKVKASVSTPRTRISRPRSSSSTTRSRPRTPVACASVASCRSAICGPRNMRLR